jgi:hypothetical protein
MLEREWGLSSFEGISSGIFERFMSSDRDFFPCFDLTFPLHEGSYPNDAS